MPTAARMACSRPHTRKSSSARTLRPRAFGCVDVFALRSISKDRAPCRDKSSDAQRPVGPPPTERCIQLVRDAVGIQDLNLEVLSAEPWSGAAALSIFSKAA